MTLLRIRPQTTEQSDGQDETLALRLFSKPDSSPAFVAKHFIYFEC